MNVIDPFDIHNPLCPLGLTSGREQTRRAWRLPLALDNKVGYCRSEVYFSGPCALSRQRSQPAAYARSKRSMAIRSGSDPFITSNSKAIRYPRRYVAHAGCRVDGSRSSRISLWLWFPSSSRFEDGDVIFGRTEEYFLAITAPCTAKTLCLG